MKVVVSERRDRTERRDDEERERTDRPMGVREAYSLYSRIYR